MQCFTLHRCEDETGVSGTGVVAWGIQWPDGSVSLRWLGITPSFVNYEGVDGSAVRQAIHHVQRVHGHNGKTVVRWREASSDGRKEKGAEEEAKGEERESADTPVGTITEAVCQEAVRRSEGVQCDESPGPSYDRLPRYGVLEAILRFLRG